MYKKLLKPNAILNGRQNDILMLCQVLFVFVLWNIINSTLFPKPQEIGKALVDLVLNKGVFRDFIKSIGLCCKAMFYAILVSLLLCYASVLPLFRPIALLATKLRFLPTVGLTFLFLKIADGEVDSQKVLLLVFGISVFFTTTIMGVIGGTTTEELNYARTLRFNEWKVAWEVIVLGKIAQVLEGVRQNFAMAWMMIAMVENLCKSDGGIGVIISDQNKYFKFDYVWAIQLLILITGIGMDYSLKKVREFLLPYSVLTLKK